jgi:hypothetical protein
MESTQYLQNDNNADIITNLPTNNNQPLHNELKIIDLLFENKGNAMLIKEISKLFLLAILYVLFSFPNIDNIITKMIPQTKKSVYILLGIKTISFVVIYWLIINFWLSRNT